MRQHKFKIPRAYLWPLLLPIAIFAASGAQQLATPDLGFQFSKDKLAHFLVFGLLATSILRTPRLKQLNTRSLLTAVLLTSAYGGFDEIRQSFTPGRSVELADWLADSLGALVAASLYTYWRGYRELLEWRLPKCKKIACPQRSTLSKRSRNTVITEVTKER
jgi:VanZ family protein